MAEKVQTQELRGRDFLLKIRYMNDIVKLKEKKLVECNERITSLGGNTSGEKVQSSNMSDKTSDLAIDLIEIHKEYLEAIAECRRLRVKAEELISKVSDIRYRIVLTSYFIDCLTLEEIAETMDISYQWISILKNRALMSFAEVYKNECE